MRIENDDVFNASPVFGTQPHINWGQDAPAASDGRFGTLKGVGSIYVRKVAVGHVELYCKVSNDAAAYDWRCVWGNITQRISVADFTDGGGTSGTLALTNQVPAGAIVDPMSISNVVGFAGDTTAVMIVGDGTDTDRYNTGTPSVFATAASGVDAGANSGTRFHSAAKTVTVTVTTGADFTTCKSNGAGRATISIPYHF